MDFPATHKAPVQYLDVEGFDTVVLSKFFKHPARTCILQGNMGT
jgi:hypothetical protein